MPFGRDGIDVQYTLVAVDRFVRSPRGQQRKPQILPGVRVAGLQLQGAMVTVYGSVGIAERGQRIAKVVVKNTVGAVQFNRSANEFDGDLVLARLGGPAGQQMDSFGMIRIELENLPIDLLGCRQIAGSMMLDSQCEGFVNRGHAIHDGNYEPGSQSRRNKPRRGQPPLQANAAR